VKRRTLLGALALSACAPADPRKAASFWFAYGGNNRIVLLSLLERFHAEKRDLRVDATFQGDYFEALVKLRMALLTGKAPALTHVVGEVLPYLAERGVLRDVGALDGSFGGDLVGALSQGGTFVGGHERPLVALPFNRSVPLAFYNGDVLDELGLRPPQTWDELRTFARKATVRTGDETSRWGFSCPIDWWFWASMVLQAGGEVVEGSDLTLGGAAGERALSLWQTLVHEDRTMKPPPGRDYASWQVVNGDFTSGRAAMIWSSVAFLRYLEDNAKFPVVAAPLPGLVRRGVYTGGTFFVLPKGATEEQTEVVLELLRFLLRPHQAAEWSMRTGYLPVTRPALVSMDRTGFYRDHPNDRLAAQTLSHAKPWPWAPLLFRAQREAVQPRLEAAVLHRLDPRAVLDDARRAAREDA
jgi:sn-glycerol 3-phosphate transport system substrate-binding protein